jgi:hypothetical protein
VANPDKYLLSPDNTFIGGQVGAGVVKGGVTPIKVAVHSGWVGPPDPGIQPTLHQIDGFIEGPWLTSGFTAGLIGFFDYQVISSPTAASGIPKFGAELGAGLAPGAAVGGSLDYSCSLSLSHLAVRLTSTLRRFLSRLVNRSGEPASNAGSQAQQFIKSLSSDDPTLGNGLQGLIVHCNPFRGQG